MSDESRPFYAPNAPQVPPRQPKPGEVLFEFVRESDHKCFRSELRFHRETYGWQVQFFEHDDFVYGRGAFVTRALAVQFAERERKAIEKQQQGFG